MGPARPERLGHRRLGRGFRVVAHRPGVGYDAAPCERPDGDGGLSDSLIDQQINLLLGDIAAGVVIPVIGPDLLTVRRDGKDVSLYSYIAAKLAERLQVASGSLPDPPSLNAVVCAYMQQPRGWDGSGRPVAEDVYPFVREILAEARLPLPQPLLDLARIEPFGLFVTTTFDTLLAQAINQQRFGGEPRTLELKYSQPPDDLPQHVNPKEPIVYHLFGKVSGLPYDYVVSDEDMLEFVHRLQGPLPLNLFTALKDHRLLFIGCAFSDWLARFLLRIAYERRLSQGGRRGRDMLVGSAIDPAGNFTLFLDTFSPATKFIPHPAAEFVAMLAARHRERYGGAAGQPAAPQRPGAVSISPDQAKVFISYAREDTDAARRLYDFLLTNGIETWFDEKENKGGDDWKRAQARNIESCAYFIPVISAHSAGRMEGEYRAEWAQAAERAHRRYQSLPLIIPVAIDDTAPETQGVPAEFKRAHWERLPRGAGTEAFAKLMRERIRDYVRSARRA
jgi:hypothetical protein